MPHDVTVCVCTYGDIQWIDLAKARALPSAYRQTAPPRVIHRHDRSSLALARNGAARDATTKYLIFLDADDELDRGYVEAMLRGTADVRRPSTVGIVDGVQVSAPVMMTGPNLLEANYIVIGAMVDREKMLAVGGFSDYPVLEDWDLWIRLKLARCSFEPIPEAIYRVHIAGHSRNRNEALQREYYKLIADKYRGCRIDD